MAERIRAHDWAATPLESLEHWSPRLKLAVEMVLANPLVASITVAFLGFFVCCSWCWAYAVDVPCRLRHGV
ncbi:hypothetical protein [Methylobacterium sp. P5_C11]